MTQKKKDTVLSLLLEIRDYLKGQTSVVITVEKPFISKSNGRFTTLADGWVKDAILGIDWSPSSDKKMNWEEAKKFCADKGGRLPEVEELSRLVDYKKSSPAIDKDFFLDTKTDDWYWTGTTRADWSGYAWMVYFGYGVVSLYGKGNINHVRAVRPSK